MSPSYAIRVISTMARSSASLAFWMGMLFPLGLAQVSAKAPALLPGPGVSVAVRR